MQKNYQKQQQTKKNKIRTLISHVQQVANQSLTLQDCQFLLQKITNQSNPKIFSNYLNKYHPKNSSSSIHFQKKSYDILPPLMKRQQKKQNWQKQNQKMSQQTFLRITKQKYFCPKHLPQSLKQRKMLQDKQLYQYTQNEKLYRKKISYIIKKANFELNSSLKQQIGLSFVNSTSRM